MEMNCRNVIPHLGDKLRNSDSVSRTSRATIPSCSFRQSREVGIEKGPFVVV
jgi:hypothetical protein